MKETKLPSHTATINSSPDGALIAVAGYDGSINIFDAHTLDLVYKNTIKGKRDDLTIYHQQISHDNRLYCFSCVKKFFVVDLQTKEIIHEINFHPNSCKATEPFVLDHRSENLIIPHDKDLKQVHLPSGQERIIPVGESTNLWSMAISSDDTHIAYQAGLRRTIFIINLQDVSTNTINVPYVHIPGKATGEVLLQFIDNTDLIFILSKNSGVFIYDYKTTELIKTISYEELGFRSVFQFHRSRISGDGKILGMNTETSKNGTDLKDWFVSVPDGMKMVLYDLEEKKILFELKNDIGAFDFHMPTKRVALRHLEVDVNKWEESLRVYEL